MANPDSIHIEVAYATPQKQVLLTVAVPDGATVIDAIETSKIKTQFPEIDLSKNKVGIFSNLVTLETPLKEKDRIEIYRPLTIDPKQKRKLRAKSTK